jgi:hypothetical protein
VEQVSKGEVTSRTGRAGRPGDREKIRAAERSFGQPESDLCVAFKVANYTFAWPLRLQNQTFLKLFEV